MAVQCSHPTSEELLQMDLLCLCGELSLLMVHFNTLLLTVQVQILVALRFDSLAISSREINVSVKLG